MALLWVAPSIALAEPAASLSHIPVLWLAVVGISISLASIPYFLRKRSGRKISGKAFWIVLIVIAVGFAILFGPVIVGLGSILITGRTM